MRVIGGKFKSRKLKFPKTKQIRPATDRLKETIFNVLGQDVSGLRVLDLYAGMGSLGIEALSRGADHVAFVESSTLGIRYIEENLRDLGLTDRADVLMADVLDVLPKINRPPAGREADNPYHILFIDPPYNKGLVKKTLLLVERFDILAPFGQIVIEHSRQEELPSLETLCVDRTNHYGITCLSFLYKPGFQNS